MITKTAEPLPKWMMRKYALLWQTFKENEFTLKESEEQIKEDKKILLVLFSRLRRLGWLYVKFNEKDARKRIYKLKEATIAVEEMQK
jgi:hypothetical protein